ncbi:MAG: cadmium-translocating P-type ATPase [Campylobacteraceae bacterium]|jgi:Cd2+/Zn2+-exporting ATPase|nr:cadmium-translocating P-type ATPase [Campylobacteraceae bacterium]
MPKHIACSCHHDEHKKKDFKNIRIIVGTLLFLFCLLVDIENNLKLTFFLISYLLIGADVLLRAFSNIQKLKNFFDENFLMSAATIGAFAIGEYPEGIAVMLFYQAGEWLQKRAVNNSVKSISALLDLKPDFANLKQGGKTVKVAPEKVKKGSIIIVRAGEKVPLDGIVVSGESFLDMSNLSGESLPKEVKKGSQILSGSINKSGLLQIEVTNEFKDSTISKIVEFTQNAAKKKAKTEKFITKFAKIYTPIVVSCAILLAALPPLLLGAEFDAWLYRALIFLVISCPCALVLSVPLSFFAGLGGAGKHGILIKGSNYLESLSNAHTIVFDKTGTLTKGEFAVAKIEAANNFNKEDLLRFCAYSESFSRHPIAQSILKAYGKEINHELIESHEEIVGFGIKAVIEGKTVLTGSERLMEKYNVSYEKISSENNIVYIAIDGIYAGYIISADEIKNESFGIVHNLKTIGIERIAMLTGDSKNIGKKVAKELEINEVFTELLPLQKVEKIEALSSNLPKNKKLIFVGDGINDAPSLSRADVGMAFASYGQDLTTQAADVVLMSSDPQKVVTAVKLAKKTTNIAWQNIIFAISIKTVLMALGIAGVSGMWEAVFADVGVSILALINAARAFKTSNILQKI